MPRTKPHGYKRRNDFKKGQLVRWNHWKSRDDWYKDHTGKMRWHTYMASDLGIVLRVYQSTSKARCWTADVAFMDSIRNHLGDPEYPIPLNCLEATE